MAVAEATRAAAREHPFLLAALRADVLNYTAAARLLSEDVDGDTESIATALRRFADSLPALETETRDARVTMRSGLAETDDPAEALLVVGDTPLAPDGGSLTAVVARGNVDPTALGRVLDRLAAAGVRTLAAGVAGETLAVAVERRDGPDAVRAVEDALESVRRYAPE